MINEILNTSYKELEKIGENSIDMIYADFDCADYEIDYFYFIKNCIRTLTNTGVLVCVANDFIAATLLLTGKHFYRYSLIWNNTTAMQLNKSVTDRPITKHRQILVFSKNRDCEYNPSTLFKANIYCPDNVIYGTSVISCGYTNKETFISANQKPVNLYRELIRTFSYEENVILDVFSDRGLFLSEAVSLNRNYIGFESDVFSYKFATNTVRKSEIKNDRLSSTLYFPMVAVN